MKKGLEIVLIVAAILAVVTLVLLIGKKKDDRQQADATVQDVVEGSQRLDAVWAVEKEEYQRRYSEKIQEVEAKIAALENAVDNGNEERRASINEQLSDLRRLKDDLNQRLDEITAATAIKWTNIQGDVSDFIEDLKD